MRENRSRIMLSQAENACGEVREMNGVKSFVSKAESLWITGYRLYKLDLSISTTR